MPSEDEDARGSVLRSLGIKRRSSTPGADKPAQAEPAAEPIDEHDPLADMTGSMDAAEDLSPPAKAGGGTPEAATPSPSRPAEPEERDTSLGIRRRSGPTAQPEQHRGASSSSTSGRTHAAPPPEAKPSDPAIGPGVTTGKNLGSSTADQLLATILRTAEARAGKGKLEHPYPEEWNQYPRTHGFYMGNGKGPRRVKVFRRPLGIAWACPPAWQMKEEKIPPPEMADDGFDVAEQLNKLGTPYAYVAFLLPEGQKPPEDEDATKRNRGAANRESGRIAGLGIKRRSK